VRADTRELALELEGELRGRYGRTEVVELARDLARETQYQQADSFRVGVVVERDSPSIEEFRKDEEFRRGWAVRRAGALRRAFMSETWKDLADDIVEFHEDPEFAKSRASWR
jgi:alkanesulfonate monooxygenase SsuD/methylene tetrahydromethanopterin reductase-like flavin-dependent oxidoreductase (luciferase family)